MFRTLGRFGLIQSGPGMGDSQEEVSASIPGDTGGNPAEEGKSLIVIPCEGEIHPGEELHPDRRGMLLPGPVQFPFPVGKETRIPGPGPVVGEGFHRKEMLIRIFANEIRGLGRRFEVHHGDVIPIHQGPSGNGVAPIDFWIG